MKNIYSNIYKANKINLKKAKKNLENNNIIGLPTETVYGLAGNAYSNKSIKKIFFLKKRPLKNPLIVHFKNLNQAKRDVIINSDFKKLYKYFCPGPITFVLNKKKISKISKKTTAGKMNVAVRFPKHYVARKLLKILNFPLAAPSANISSKLSPTSAKDVYEEFGKKINLILDGGNCKIGLESTIIDLTNQPTILRHGGVTIENIQKVLRKKIKINQKNNKILMPGQLKSHYYPGIPVLINKKSPAKNQAFIYFGKKVKKGSNYFNISQNGNLNKIANNLYRAMRKIKNKNFKSIAIARIPNKGIGRAINDRIRKASNK